MPVNERDHALVVGFNHYPDYGSRGRPLRGAIRDARSFREWLVDAATGGGLPDENCVLVTSSIDTVDPPQPRKSVIDEALVRIHRKVNEEGGRRFYLYFSGHGQTHSVDDVALCMPNWSRDMPAAALSFRKVLQQVLECMRFEEVVVLLDCCRSRKVTARAQDTEFGCARPRDDAGSTVKFVGFATEFQAAAFEAEVDDPSDEPVVHGHFTQALLAALRGAAARPDGGVTAGALWGYLRKVVPRVALRHGHQQAPRIEPFDVPPGDPAEPIFGAAARIPTVDVRIRFRSGREGTVVLEGPDLREIRRGSAQDGAWDETLPVAVHLLRDLDSGETLDLRLEAAAEPMEVVF